jgi:hypothetical protein
MGQTLISEDIPGWPHNQLERDLEEASRASAHLPVFWTTLLAVEVIVPDHPSPEWGDGAVAFSSLDTLKHSVDSVPNYSAVKGRDLLETAATSGFVLNPRGPHPIALSPREVRSVLAGLAPIGGNQAIAIDEVRVSVGRLADEPEDLIEAVTRACKNDSSIRAAYLSGILFPGEGETLPHPLIGIEADSYESTRNSLGKIFAEWSARSGKLVDAVDMRTAGPLQEHLRKQGRVLYRRGLGLFRWLFSR